MSIRRIAFFLSLASLAVLVIGIPIRSQFVRTQANSDLIVGRNVNMVSGDKLPGGDPYLQRQNEPSIAVSTRNAMRLFAGSNDYRTIDWPYEDQVPGYEYINATDVRDAWVSTYQSHDGGQSWTSTLLPGFPQDISPEGLASPLKAFGTAADPVVKAGTNGLFYYAGIAFNRVDRGSGVIFVARFIDLNNQENEDTIKYDGVSIIAQGNAGQFLDKPWIAVDMPRSEYSQAVLSNQDVLAGQTASIPCGNVYIAYSAFVGQSAINVRSKILFSVSTDCGRTWSSPIKLSESQHIDQGATIAIDPNTGAIYVAWRRFTHPSQPSAILIAKSIDKGKSFTKAVEVRTLAPSFPPLPYGPFDQRTEARSFRTNSYPAMAVDHSGVVYLAWADRDSSGRSLISMAYSSDGINWYTPATPVDSTGDGHQFMPSLSYAAGKLVLIWYDQRRDISLGCDNTGLIEDITCRHNIDVRVAEIDPVDSLGLGLHTSKQVSRYLCTYETVNGDPIFDTINGQNFIRLIQLQYNFPNLRLFQKGTVPFLGDYIEITPAPQFLPQGNSWVYNTDRSQEAVFHVAWTDNRDVREGNPAGYFAPNSDQSGSGFPNGQCNDSANTGVLNQNVYTACISQGFVAGSPGNAKPLYLEGDPFDTNDHPIPRAFTVFVKNMTDEDKDYTLQILAPQDVEASFFEYFDVPQGMTYPVDFLLVEVAAHSSISRPVFVYPYAENPQATVKVVVKEGATSSTVLLNPDPTNPIIDDPYDDYQGPNIRGKEVHSPNIRGVSVNKAISKSLINPNIRGSDPNNPNIRGADIVNSDSANPNIRGNPLNPNIRGTDVESPNIRGESISEIIWEVENTGNTTTPYNFYASTDYVRPDGIPLEEAMQFQLLIYRVYYTPVAQGCALEEEEHHELITNIPNPNIRGTSVPDGDIENATFYLKPGEKALIKLLAIDPVPDNNDDFDFGDSLEETSVQAEVQSMACNSDDLENGIYTPPGDTSIPPGPALISPSEGAILDNGCDPQNESIEWGFDWQDVPDAIEYNLYVQHIGPPISPIPIINEFGIASSSFNYYAPSDHVIEDNRFNWIWKVRARVTGVDGTYWSAWSEERSFDVEPLNTDCPVPVNPEINIKQGANDIIDGGSFDFGTQALLSDTDITFTVENTGNADLFLNGAPIVSISGTNADQFNVQQQPASPVAPLQSYNFVIRFHPTSSGPKTASLSIANNDSDENPYDITLLGNGAAVGENLVAYYPFNGNANDESGNGNNGTVNGAILAPDRYGIANRAYYFDGVDDGIVIPHSSSLDITSSITLTAWIKPSQGSTSGDYIVQKRKLTTGGAVYSLDIFPGQIRGLFSYGTTSNTREATGTTSIAADQWQQIAVTWNGSLITVYYNGQSDGTASFTEGSIQTSNGALEIGYYSGGVPVPYFNGLIDDVRIYNYGLTATEIANLYQAESSGLIAHYPFNGNANDESGNGHNGTIHGNATYSNDRKGNANGALNFDGISNYVELPDESSFDLTNFTMVAVVKIPDYDAFIFDIISKGAGYGNYNLHILGDQISGQDNVGKAGYAQRTSGGNWSHLVTLNPAPVNQYLHIAVTIDSSTFKSYLNGQNEWTAPCPGRLLNNENAIIGAMNSSGVPAYFFKGQIDEIRVYSRALSASEIQALYNQ